LREKDGTGGLHAAQQIAINPQLLWAQHMVFQVFAACYMLRVRVVLAVLDYVDSHQQELCARSMSVNFCA
jgi:hypothetical protein